MARELNLYVHVVHMSLILINIWLLIQTKKEVYCF